MWLEIIYSTPFIFLISIIVALIFYSIGGSIGFKGKKTIEKLAVYACGENLPPEKLQVNVQRFFIYGLYFLIFDSIAFLLALSFSFVGIFPLVFAVIALVAIAIIIPLRW